MSTEDAIEIEFQTWLNQMYSKYPCTRFDIGLYVAKFLAQQLPSHVSIKESSTK